jgi:UPF0755 protein
MIKFFRKLLKLLFIVLAAIVAALVWYEAAIHYQIKQDTKIAIKEGEKVAVIAADLVKAGLIKSQLAFKIYLKLHGTPNLLAGDYIFKTGDNLPAMVKRLAHGEADFQEKDILIKEGTTLKEINKYLQDNKLLAQDCTKLFSTYISKLPPELLDNYDFLKEAPTRVDLEGFIFPDTYRVFANATCADLITKALNNFNNKFDTNLRAEAKQQNKSIWQVLIMASILEKEVKTEADMKIVAGIFWDRIANGQRLESDATLAYGLGDSKSNHNAAELQSDSPYNTYRRDGLPPTPIDNPGLTAIRAALYPTKSDYNYFLTRPDTGETVFAKTFAEHKANKLKYLK